MFSFLIFFLAMFLRSSIYYRIFQQQGNHKRFCSVMWEVVLQKQGRDKNLPHFMSIQVKGSQDINESLHSQTFPPTDCR